MPSSSWAGLVTRRPAAQVAVDLDTGAREAGVARARVGGVLLAGLARGIHVGQHVVDDPTVARPVLDRRDVHVLGQACRHDEAAVDVSARGRDREIGPDIDDQVGSAFQVQSSGNLRGGGKSAGSPSGAPASAQDARVAMSCCGERAVVLELRAQVRRRLSTGALTGPRPRRRCPRPASAPARRSPGRTAPPGPCGGIPGNSSGGSGPRPCCTSARSRRP